MSSVLLDHPTVNNIKTDSLQFGLALILFSGFGLVGSVPSPVSGGSVAAIPGEDTRGVDAVAALMALGVKPAEAHDSVRAALAMLGAEATVEQLIRACLRRNA